MRNKLIPPGFTIFSKEDYWQAINVFLKRDLVPRMKFPFKSGLSEQRLIYCKQEAFNLSKCINWDRISRVGLVLEANVINTVKSSNPKSYTTATIELDRYKYSYIGEQIIKEEKIPGVEYLTKFRIVKGQVKKLYSLVSNDLKPLVDKTMLVHHAFRLLPHFICSRFNFNFIYGQIETWSKKGSSRHSTDIYFTEQTFRPGRATGGVLLSVKEFLLNPGIRYISAESSTHFGKKYPKQYRYNSKIFFDGIDPYYGPTQCWAILNSIKYLSQ